MGQLAHLEELKMVEMQINSMDSNRHVGIQSMKEKEEIIEQLNQKLLIQEQDFTKLAKVNKLLK